MLMLAVTDLASRITIEHNDNGEYISYKKLRGEVKRGQPGRPITHHMLTFLFHIYDTVKH